MKTLFLALTVLISMSIFSQQFRGMRQAELKFLKRYGINYMSPWARHVVNDKLVLESYSQSDQKILKSTYSRFITWNNNNFAANPANASVILDGSSFYYNIDPNPCQITGKIRISINRDDIEYIEIVEYNVVRGNITDRESIILVKYVYHPVEHYWNDTFYEECGQCPTLN
jgi:hypothetical protein